MRMVLISGERGALHLVALLLIVFSIIQIVFLRNVLVGTKEAVEIAEDASAHAAELELRIAALEDQNRRTVLGARSSAVESFVRSHPVLGFRVSAIEWRDTDHALVRVSALGTEDLPTPSKLKLVASIRSILTAFPRRATLEVIDETSNAVILAVDTEKSP